MKHDVTQTNKFAVTVALWVTKEVGVKEGERGEKKEPLWKRKIKSDFTNLKRDINRVKRERLEETGGKGKDLGTEC